MSQQAENDANDGLRERLQKQGEDALGRVAQELLESPLVHKALAGAFDAREKAVQAQEAAMGALNLPSAADLERLTRRVRSLSQRLEGIEDGVDRVDERLAEMLNRPPSGVEERLSGIEDALQRLGNEVEALRKKVGAGGSASPPKKPVAKKPAARKPVARKPAGS
jgi:chromosome segregation ATPase